MSKPSYENHRAAETSDETSYRSIKSGQGFTFEGLPEKARNLLGGNRYTGKFLLIASAMVLTHSACKKAGKDINGPKTKVGEYYETDPKTGDTSFYTIVCCPRDTDLTRVGTFHGNGNTTFDYNSEGDTLVKNSNGTVIETRRRVPVTIGGQTKFLGDPSTILGSPSAAESIVQKMEKYEFAFVRPGYYDIPSNPPGQLRARMPNNGVASMDLSDIDSMDHFVKGTSKYLRDHGMILNQTTYTDREMPNFADPAACAYILEHVIKPVLASGNAPKGQDLGGFDKIAYVSNLQHNGNLITGAVGLLRDGAQAAKDKGKITIASDVLYKSDYLTLAKEAGEITPYIGHYLSAPITDAGGQKWLQDRLAEAEIGAKGDIRLYVNYLVNENSPASNTANAKALQALCAPARTDGHTIKIFVYYTKSINNDNVADLDANQVNKGIIAMQEKSHLPYGEEESRLAHFREQHAKEASYLPEPMVSDDVRIAANPHNRIDAAKLEDRIADAIKHPART